MSSSEQFVGDEDNGEMSAWYVLSALGLFATSVGINAKYTLGAVPLFPGIKLKALNLTITAPAAAQNPPDTAIVTLRSIRVEGPSVEYAALRQGGALYFGPEAADTTADAEPLAAATEATTEAKTAEQSALEKQPAVTRPASEDDS